MPSHRTPLVIGGAALAALLVGWAGWSGPEATVVEPGAGFPAKPSPSFVREPFVAARSDVAQPSATPTLATTAPLPHAPAATVAARAVPIAVIAPRHLLVGELGELLVNVGAHAGVGEISFSVQFDADVLQVRAGSDGGWAAGEGQATQFAAEINGAEDHISVRSVAVAARAGQQGGGVATIQFQAVAPGHTSVIVSDVVVKDRAGSVLSAAVSASNLQIVVDSWPPAKPLRR